MTFTPGPAILIPTHTHRLWTTGSVPRLQSLISGLQIQNAGSYGGVGDGGRGGEMVQPDESRGSMCSVVTSPQTCTGLYMTSGGAVLVGEETANYSKAK